MSCRKYEKYISYEIDNQITAKQLNKLNLHCTNCNRCKLYREKYTQIRNLCLNMACPEFDNNSFALDFSIPSHRFLKKYVYALSFAAVLLIVFSTVTVFNKFYNRTEFDEVTMIINADIADEIFSAEQHTPARTQTEDDIIEEIPDNKIELYKSETEAITQYDMQKKTDYAEDVSDFSTADIQTDTTLDLTNQATSKDTLSEDVTDDLSASSGGGGSSGGSAAAQPETDTVTLVSSEKYRNQIIDTLYSNSIYDGVNENSNFTVNMSNECFTSVINELNADKTEYVISTIPETLSVIVSFEFQSDDAESIIE